MSCPENFKYTKTHEWANLEAGKTRVGISDYAQKEISDVVFVELPKVGQDVEQGKSMCVIESVKAAFDIYAPVTGKVIAVNSQLDTQPETVNDDPFEQGWLVDIEMSDPSQLDQLMDWEAYQTHIQQAAKETQA